MISQLIDKAAEKIGGQNQLARRIGIPNGRMSDFKNYEESKRKPPDEVIIALADILGLDKGETLYQAKLELDPKKASYWKFLVRSAGLEPTPQASELKTIHRALKLPYFIQCLQIAIKVCIAFSRRYIPMPKQVFNRINAYT